MSRTQHTEREAVELLFLCRYCAAKPGAWCLATSKDGLAYGPAQWLHTSRYEQAYQVCKALGWVEAEQEMRDRFYRMRKHIRGLRDAVYAQLPNETHAALTELLAI